MPIPTRSRSLRQPGFSNTQSNGVKAGASAKETTRADGKDEALQQKQSTQSKANCDMQNARTTAHSGLMGPPSQIQKVSSIRKPPGEGMAASHEATDRLSASSASVKQTRTAKGSLPMSQHVSTESSSLNGNSQSTDQAGMTRKLTSEALAKSRLSLHSRSQSVAGAKSLRGHPQDPIAAHSKQSSISSDTMMQSTRPPVSGQGINITKTPNVVVTKPQFSAHQQHLSPKKTSKTPAPPNPGQQGDRQHASNTISAASANRSGPAYPTADLQGEISRLQDELLQLQLMFDSSHSQQQNYLPNTMQKLKARFQALSRDHLALTANEHAYRKETNCAALQQWLSEGELSGLGKIHILANCVQEVATMTAPDGKLCKSMEEFETWFERAMNTRQSRSSATARFECYHIFIRPLGQEWHDVVASVHMRLNHCSRVLSNLGLAIEGSGLAMVLGTHRRFLDNLRQELEYYDVVEKIILEREQVWIEESVARIMQEDDQINADDQRNDPKLRPWNVKMT